MTIDILREGAERGAEKKYVKQCIQALIDYPHDLDARQREYATAYHHLRVAFRCECVRLSFFTIAKQHHIARDLELSDAIQAKKEMKNG